jgi:hypothetical protein
MFFSSFIFCVLAFWVYDRYDVIVFPCPCFI